METGGSEVQDHFLADQTLLLVELCQEEKKALFLVMETSEDDL